MKKMIWSLVALVLSVSTFGAPKVEIIAIKAMNTSVLQFQVKERSGKVSSFNVRTGFIRKAMNVEDDAWVTFYTLIQEDTLCLSYKGTQCDRFLGEVDSNGNVTLFPNVFSVPILEKRGTETYFRWQISLWLGD